MADSEKPQVPGLLTVISTSTDGIRVLTVVGDLDHNTAGPLAPAEYLIHTGGSGFRGAGRGRSSRRYRAAAVGAA
ncbi:hypothetical protein [Streptomyces incanus]